LSFNPTNVEDFRVTLFDEIKAFMLFISKCILTLGILPLVEAIKGESVILPSNRECKMRAEKEQTSFINFVSNNRQRVGVQLS